MNRKAVTIKLFGIIAVFLIVLIGAMLFLQTRYFGSYYEALKREDFKAQLEEFTKSFDGLHASDDELFSRLRLLRDRYGVVGLLFSPSDDFLKSLKNGDPEGIAIMVDKEYVPLEVVAFMQKLALSSDSNKIKPGEPLITQVNGLDYLVAIHPVSVNDKDYFIGIATSIQPVNEAIKVLQNVSWLVYTFAIVCSLALAVLISLLVARPLIREIEKEKALDRMRKEFIANASHEMKTPISIISGYIESIRDGLLTSEERQEYELAIEDETSKMGMLVRDMLEMALLQNEQYEPRKTDVDAISFMHSILHRLNGQIKEKNLNVELDYPESITALADERMLEIVVVNLLSNAIVHTANRGTIQIRMDREKDAFHFEIENDGALIPDESLPHIWEAFYRVDKSHNREAGRFGLGLSIVKMIVEKHGGFVAVQNKERSVIFTFDLPRTSPYSFRNYKGN